MMATMLLLAAASGTPHVWHFWLAAVLAPVTILMVLAMVGRYFFKVTRSRYPQR